MYCVLWSYGLGMGWHCATPVFLHYEKAQQYVDRISGAEDTAGRVWRVCTIVPVPFSAKSADTPVALPTLQDDLEGRN